MAPTRRSVLTSASLLGASLIAGCSALSPPTPAKSKQSIPMLAADIDRNTNPDVSGDTIETLVDGNTQFAIDLFHHLAANASTENVFLSPYSISTALAMTWAGARGSAEQQMAQTLHYDLTQDRLHPAFNSLDRTLDRRDESAATTTRDDEGQPFELRTVNAIWGQQDYPFRESYLEVLARNYGAGLRVQDFISNPEKARTTINDWVAEQTNDKIEDLLSEGVITALTRLVLTNAIYFKANWATPFNENATEDATFTALDGSTSSVPMMEQRHQYPYAEVDGHQLVELPYVGGDVSMVVLLPAEDEFQSVEQSLDTAGLQRYLDALESKEGTVRLPQFTYGSKVSLKDALSALGMPIAFDPDEADFGGMADLQQANGTLYIRDVIHQSQITVDEKGTEAAAATGVVMADAAAPANPFEMVVDRPFLYLIQDRETGTILFLGRVVDAGTAQ